jgi:hypothetical protein
MATTYKVLGQSAPSATTATTLYTVPSATEAVISTVFVCNRGADAATYRIAVRPNGATLANEHYIAYDVLILGKTSTAITVGVTMDAADVLTIYASSGDLSFNAFGSEVA